MGTRVPLPLQDALRDGPDRLKIQDDAPSRNTVKQQFSYCVGGLPSAASFITFANSFENARCALLERVFYHEIGGVFVKPDDPSIQVVKTLLQPFKRAFLPRLPHATPMGRQEYVDATYSGRRKVVYQKAVDKLQQRGLLRSDAYLSTFLKWEKILRQNKRQVPRVIQPRSPAFNVELGRYLHPIEHAVYNSIDRTYGHRTVMKGLNALEQGRIFHEAWARYRRPKALLIDAARFDQHIRSGLLEWEHAIYLFIFQNDSLLARMLRWQLRNTGFMRSGGKLMKYVVNGGRCSGDMNTAMGNIIIACASVYAWLHSQGVERKCRVLDAGDDCCIIGEAEVIEKIAPTLQPWFAQIGLIMKVEPLVDVLEQISFCQTSPVYDGRQWRMVRDPRVSLSKDSCVIHQRYLLDLKSYYASIGDCGMSLTGGLPVLQEYYRALGAGKVCPKPVDEYMAGTGFFRLASGMREGYRLVTDDARVSFWRAFGIPPDLQLALEAHYRSWTLPHDLTVRDDEVDKLDLGIGVACCN